MPFERVHTVCDFYDRPRCGIADFEGGPHYYKCEWDETADDYADTFVLTPLDRETFELALEQWALWLESQKAFQSGDAPLSTHPQLAGRPARYIELDAILKERIASITGSQVRARGVFRVPRGQLIAGASCEFEVEWSEVR
jgi:hypothetical protein